MFSMPKMEMVEFEVESIMTASVEEETTTSTTKKSTTQGNWGEEDEF